MPTVRHKHVFAGKHNLANRSTTQTDRRSLMQPYVTIPHDEKFLKIIAQKIPERIKQDD